MLARFVSQPVGIYILLGFVTTAILYMVLVSPAVHRSSWEELVNDVTPRAITYTLNEIGTNLSARETYRLWDRWQMPRMNTSVNSMNPNKFLVYRCGENDLCGGWADRLKGMMMGYVMANLTQRTFKIQMTKPRCKMTDYMLPNSVDWSSVKEFDDPSSGFLNVVDNMFFKYNIINVNFKQVIDDDKVVMYFLANLEYMSGLGESKIYASELSWMRDVTPADVYSVLYKRLFKLAPKLQQQIDDLLELHLPSPKHKLLCAHVRLGQNPSIKTDSEQRNTMNNVKNVWKFLHNVSMSDLDRFYVMSDSDEVIKSAQHQTFADRLVTIPGTIVHVDKGQDRSQLDQCLGLEKIILEMHMLMNCDLLIRGHSGLSTIAAAIRHTDENLFCFRRNGAIETCSRNDFSTFV